MRKDVMHSRSKRSRDFFIRLRYRGCGACLVLSVIPCAEASGNRINDASHLLTAQTEEISGCRLNRLTNQSIAIRMTFGMPEAAGIVRLKTSENLRRARALTANLRQT